MTATDTSIVPLDGEGREIIRNGFTDSAGSVGQLALHAGTASSVAREEAEMKTAIVLARSNPRNEHAAFAKIMGSCGRITFADGAVYSFPRGGQTVSGPSIQMARELARCWGNVRFGIRIVTEDTNNVHIKGYAYDLESNNYVEAEDKFQKLVQRKGGWVKPDERDLRELINRRGAICVRNAILQIMPPDIVDDAVTKVQETLRKAANGELEKDRPAAIKKMVMSFADVHVTAEMLATKLGHPLDIINDAEFAELRTIFASIRDGNSKREEHFDIGGAKAEPGKAGAAALAAQLSKKVVDAPAAQEQGAGQGGKSEPNTAPVAPPSVAGAQASLLPTEAQAPTNGRRR